MKKILFLLIFFLSFSPLFCELKWDPTKTTLIPEGTTYYLAEDGQIVLTDDFVIDGVLEVRANIVFVFARDTVGGKNYHEFINNGSLVIKEHCTCMIIGGSGGDAKRPIDGDAARGCGATFLNKGQVILEDGSYLYLASGDGGNGGKVGWWFKKGASGGDGGFMEFYNFGNVLLGSGSMMVVAVGEDGEIGKGSFFFGVGKGEPGVGGTAQFHHFGELYGAATDDCVFEVQNGGELRWHGVFGDDTGIIVWRRDGVEFSHRELLSE